MSNQYTSVQISDRRHAWMDGSVKSFLNVSPRLTVFVIDDHKRCLVSQIYVPHFGVNLHRIAASVPKHPPDEKIPHEYESLTLAQSSCACNTGYVSLHCCRSFLKSKASAAPLASLTPPSAALVDAIPFKNVDSCFRSFARMSLVIIL